MTPIDKLVLDFVQRCDALAARWGWTRARLSKLLFGKAGFIGALASGESGATTHRLREGYQRLTEFEKRACAPDAASAIASRTKRPARAGPAPKKRRRA